MCHIAFKGEGYSSHFVKNFGKIVDFLKENENTLIKVVTDLDDICKACPNQTPLNSCNTQEKIEKLDNAYIDALDLKSGDIFTAKEVKTRLKDKMTLDIFHKACEECEWKKYGMCEEALKKLLNS